MQVSDMLTMTLRNATQPSVNCDILMQVIAEFNQHKATLVSHVYVITIPIRLLTVNVSYCYTFANSTYVILLYVSANSTCVILLYVC